MLSTVKLSVITLTVNILSVITLTVNILSVYAECLNAKSHYRVSVFKTLFMLSVLFYYFTDYHFAESHYICIYVTFWNENSS